MPTLRLFHPVRDLFGVWAMVFVISGFINVLALSGAIYMLQVYDRVLTSRSVETLVALSLLVGGLYLVLGALDAIRGQMLLRIGDRIDTGLMPKAFAALSDHPLHARSPALAVQPVRDVDTIRSYFTQQGAVAPLDLPWAPIFLIFVWALHPTLGFITLAALAALLLLATVNAALTAKPERAAMAGAMARIGALDATCRNAEVIAAMGLGPASGRRFQSINQAYLDHQRRAGDYGAALGSAARTLRLLLQAAILGVGALLAINGEMSAGAIIAASIAAARTLVPVEQAIATWKSFMAARQSYQRLRVCFAALPAEAEQLSLPRPRHAIAVDRLAVVPPGATRPSVVDVSFALKAGTALAIVGKSGAGKSSLARALTGIWPAARGSVRFDGAPLERWPARERGRCIGYMPQQITLFPGTVADNIARLAATPDAMAVIAAARAAGLHDTILALPQGYETEIDADGAPLSAGQRQQIGLARALYGNPFVVVLDEPNANLDADGEQALTKAIVALKAEGAIVVVIAQRRSLLSAVDMVAVIEAGHLRSLTARSKFLGAHLTPIPTGPDRVKDKPDMAEKRSQGGIR